MALKSFTVAPPGKGTPTVKVGIVRTSKPVAAGRATAVVSVGIKRAFVVTPAGISTATITIRMKRAITVTPAGVATVTPALAVRHTIALSVAGAAAVTVGVVDQHPTSVAPHGQSAATITFSARRALSIVAGGTSTVTPSLVRWRDVTAGPVAGISTATLTFVRWRNATLAAAGTSTATIALSAIRTLAATANGVASIALNLGRLRTESVSVAGLSTVVVSVLDIPGTPGMAPVVVAGQSSVTLDLESIVAPVVPAVSSGGGAGRPSRARRFLPMSKVAPKGEHHLKQIDPPVAGRSTVNLTLTVRRAGSVVVGGGALVEIRPQAITPPTIVVSESVGSSEGGMAGRIQQASRPSNQTDSAPSDLTSLPISDPTVVEAPALVSPPPVTANIQAVVATIAGRARVSVFVDSIAHPQPSRLIGQPLTQQPEQFDDDIAVIAALYYGMLG